jgi:hypothetical protein
MSVQAQPWTNRIRLWLGALLAATALLGLLPAGSAKAHGGYYFDAHIWKSGGSVGHSGHLAMSYGHWASLTVEGWRKVCGFWGCNYERQVGRTFYSNGGNYIPHQPIYESCKPGTNRYETKSVAIIQEWFYRYQDQVFSQAPEYSC